MNKFKNYISVVIVTTSLLLAASCGDSFLEIEPKGKLIAKRTADYNLMLNNVDLFNPATDGPVLMGDEIVYTEPYFSAAAPRRQRLFRWDADIYEIDENASETLVPLKNLYAYNVIINDVMASAEGTEVEKKAIQAEALAGRAWTYFQLINYYGKPYTAETAATDLGFPIITVADINATEFTRATVQEVYDQIIGDLTTAIPNLASVGVPHRIRMSQAAAQGILAKVYIFMGRFDEALPLLDASIDHLAASAVVTGLYNFNAAFPGFPLATADQENIYSRQFSNNFTGPTNNGVMLTPAAAALYGVNDIRRARWFTPMTFPDGTTLLRRSGSLVTFFGIKVPDLYLLRAEVKARRGDLEGAVADVEMLRKNRMPEADAVVPADVASDKLMLLSFIFEERVREFAVQGYRWFDMRRLSVDPLFTTPAYTHAVVSEAGDVTQTFALSGPDRFTLRIPKKIRSENPTLDDNP